MLKHSKTHTTRRLQLWLYNSHGGMQISFFLCELHIQSLHWFFSCLCFFLVSGIAALMGEKAMYWIVCFVLISRGLLEFLRFVSVLPYRTRPPVDMLGFLRWSFHRLVLAPSLGLLPKKSTHTKEKEKYNNVIVLQAKQQQKSALKKEGMYWISPSN